jgi:glucose-6-phosphate isomerase
MDDIIKKLAHQAQNQNLSKNHLASLLKDRNRFSKYSLKIPGFLYDFSRQRLTDDTLPVLFELAGKSNVPDRFKSMIQGEKINNTENRAALHTAMRDFSGQSIFTDGKDVMPQIRKVRDNIKIFSEKMRSGKLPGNDGKTIGSGGGCRNRRLVSWNRMRGQCPFIIRKT